MYKHSRKLLLLTILASGTQVITLPIGGLTIFQILLIVTAIATFADVIRNRYIYCGKYIVLGILFIFSSFIAYLTSINPDWAGSYLLLGLMTGMLILIIPIIFTKSDIPLLEKTLIRSQYIVIPFSIYSVYMYYFKGGLPQLIHLIGGMTVLLDEDLIDRAQAASQLRLTLPYSTPPVLSIVMAICLVILISNRELFRKGIRYLLIILFAVILVFTGSRSGVLGLIVAVFTWYMLDYRKCEKTRARFLAEIMMVIFGVSLLFSLSNTVYFNKLYRARSIGINLMSDRHFLVPLDGLIIWISSIKNFIIGIGFGSSYYMQGAHTYLPAYFLNSFITLIVERGFLGVVIVIYLLSLLRKGFNDTKQNRFTISERALFYSLLCGFVSCLTYEALNCYFLIFIVSIACIQANYESSVEEDV